MHTTSLISVAFFFDVTCSFYCWIKTSRTSLLHMQFLRLSSSWECTYNKSACGRENPWAAKVQHYHQGTNQLCSGSLQLLLRMEQTCQPVGLTCTKPNDSLMISLVPLVNQGCQYAGLNIYVAWSHLIRSTITNCKRIAVSLSWSTLAHVEDEINLRVSFH